MPAPTALPLRLTLPQPPSVNHYWRHVGRIVRTRRGPKVAVSVYISAEGKQYRAATIASVRAQLPRHATIAGPVEVRATLYIDRRGSDTDNRTKALGDALTHAGVWDDDAQVCRWLLERRYDRASARVELEILPVTDIDLIDAWSAPAAKAARRAAA